MTYRVLPLATSGQPFGDMTLSAAVFSAASILHCSSPLRFDKKTHDGLKSGVIADTEQDREMLSNLQLVLGANQEEKQKIASQQEFLFWFGGDTYTLFGSSSLVRRPY